MLGPHVGASSKLCNPMRTSGPGPRPDGIEVADIGSDLPQEPNSFVGRERELGELRKLLCATRMLTLTGPGGIADGACYVELADLEPGSPDLVAARVAAALGVAEEQGRPLLDTIADTLRPRELLLGLDNCEHLLDECARICHRLLASSPELRLLATSREPLRVAGETVWPVPPLAIAP